MSIKLFALATLWTATLAATFPLLTQNTVSAGFSLAKHQTQTTTISLNKDDLKFPHKLKINTFPTSTQLTGYIELNGKRLQTFHGAEIQINLSPQLTLGQHQLQIFGQYYPTNASVTVQLEGINTQVTQQISGTGELNQLMIIDVK